MAETPSTMVDLGTPAPPFSLPDPSGRKVSLSDFKGSKGYVVMFICNHCPYVKHVAPEIAKIAHEYSGKGIAFVAINANDCAKHPDDSPEKMAEEIENRGYIFPYVYDESQEIAKAYKAACTPDFFVFDADQKLVYRGQLDDSRPGSIPEMLTGKDLRGALDAVLADEPVDGNQHPSVGCNIKWKPGNEPGY